VKRHKVEWSFFNCLLDGVEEKNIVIDKKINTFSVYGVEIINPINLSILRLSTYELTTFLEVPYQIIISEYVSHSASLSTSKGIAFINNTLETIALNLKERHS
jgi:N utilization substance protein B